jgi:glycosyltransferase involved in cell wall biosynthesis
LNSPAISVIIPVYNGEKYIFESIESILKQSFIDFELIIINDGSTDRTADIILSFSDRRIRLFNQENSGMAASLNFGIKNSNGRYIARQDADDISHPLRFEREINFLETNPSCALVGTKAKIISESGKQIGLLNHPSDNAVLKLLLLFDNPFVHSSVMINRTLAGDALYYDASKPVLIQDYELWSRLSANNIIANLDDVLVDYREVKDSISRRAINYKNDVISQSASNLCRSKGNDGLSCLNTAKIYHSVFDELPDFVNVRDVKRIYKNAIKTIREKDDTESNEFRFLKNKIYRKILKKCIAYNIFGRSLKKILVSLNKIRSKT